MSVGPVILFAMLALFFIVPGGLGCWLLLRSYKYYRQLKELAATRLCKARELADGLVKMTGVVSPAQGADPLVSPMNQVSCVYFDFKVEELRQRKQLTKSGFRDVYDWVPVLTDVQALPVVVSDNTGEARLENLKAAQVHFARIREFSEDESAALKQSLSGRYPGASKKLMASKGLRCREAVIESATEIFVMGHCRMSDGKPTFVNRPRPLLVSCDGEVSFMTSEEITMIVLAVVGAVALLAVGLSGFYLFHG